MWRTRRVIGRRLRTSRAAHRELGELPRSLQRAAHQQPATTRDGGPWPGPYRFVQPCRGQLVEGAPHRRRRRHRTNTCSWWRSTSMSAIASPPPASITATSTSTRPRSCRGTNPRRASALQTSPVNPVRSACRRRPTQPAWATTPAPSPVTDKPADHEVCFTYGVPSSRDFSVSTASEF